MLAEAHNGELLGQMCPNVCPDFQRIVGCRAGCSKRKSFDSDIPAQSRYSSSTDLKTQ